MSTRDFEHKQIAFVFTTEGEKISFKNDNLIVSDTDGKIKHQSTCYRLFALFICGDYCVTTGLLERSQKFGFTIVFMTPNLRITAIMPSKAEGNVLLRKRQYEYKDSCIGAYIISNKIHNQCAVLKKKRNDIHKQNNEDYENEATNRVVDYEKKTAYDIQHYSKRIMQKRKIKSVEDKYETNEKSIKNHLKDNKIESLMNSKILTVSNKKVKNEGTTLFSDKANDHYQMKSHFISKHKNKIKELKQNTHNLKKTPSTGIKLFKRTVNVVKRSITGINQFITLGMGLILLIVITLFIGVFSALSDDSSVENGTMYVSAEVLSYTNTIEKYAKEYDIADYVPLIQAVMMQESGGKGNDPMQSSECPYNTKYPNVPNAIQDAEYSIDCGVHYLSDCMKRANVKSVSDMQNISLALQGYNFGNGYIEWAVEHFGGYTRPNAKVFSDEMKALDDDIAKPENYSDTKKITELMKMKDNLTRAMEETEEKWLEVSSELEEENAENQ